MQLVANNNPYAGGYERALLAHTEMNLLPVDFGAPGSPMGVLHDPLSGVTFDTHQITADYAHLVI